jgi:hypothetical protein
MSKTEYPRHQSSTQIATDTHKVKSIKQDIYVHVDFRNQIQGHKPTFPDVPSELQATFTFKCEQHKSDLPCTRMHLCRLTTRTSLKIARWKFFEKNSTWITAHLLPLYLPIVHVTIIIVVYVISSSVYFINEKLLNMPELLAFH